MPVTAVTTHTTVTAVTYTALRTWYFDSRLSKAG